MQRPASGIPTLAAAVIASGWLGLQLAVPPGYASPIWPPAGIGLASLLLWGTHLWPGIWAGSFALNCWLGAAGSAEGLTAGAAFAAAGIASGSTLQALAAVWLVGRWIGPGVPTLDSPRSIVACAGLTGPLACLLAASVGVGVLHLLGRMPGPQLLFSWWNWWIGDSLGVVVLCPLMLCLFADSNAFWRPLRLTLAPAMAALLVAVIVVFALAFRSEKTRIQMELDGRAEFLGHALRSHIAEGSVRAAAALESLFLASSSVERKEFHLFAQHLLTQDPEIQALEWIPRVPADRLDALEQSVRAEGYGGFAVKERDSAGVFVPVRPRPEYYPVLFIEPWSGNETAFGYDLGSDPLRHRALEQARRSGTSSATQRIRLVQETGGQYGVLIVNPVSAAAGQPPPMGFTLTVLRLGMLVEHALAQLDRAGLQVSIRDISAPPEESLLYADPGSAATASAYGLRNWQVTIPVGDRTWQVEIAPGVDFVVRYGSWLPWTTLFGGLLFTILCNA